MKKKTTKTDDKTHSNMQKMLSESRLLAIYRLVSSAKPKKTDRKHIREALEMGMLPEQIILAIKLLEKKKMPLSNIRLIAKGLQE